jgi:hypothetical protein
MHDTLQKKFIMNTKNVKSPYILAITQGCEKLFHNKYDV